MSPVVLLEGPSNALVKTFGDLVKVPAGVDYQGFSAVLVALISLTSATFDLTKHLGTAILFLGTD